MKEYPRRFYRRPLHLAHDLRAVRRTRRRIKRLHGGESIDRAFRERLMLTVTEVNGCRYCAYVHAKAALAVGVTDTDIIALTAGSLQGCPPEQVPALLYAQHWAETDAEPDSEARERIIEIYGEAKIEAVELALRMIRVGNLMGNTVDYLLHRISFGRWGGAKQGSRGGTPYAG
ncbi:MAG: carboxymuconolactone decarboxylase family protein [Actinobacteria bacterium]|nr:carboxymuconolactone decarboxylase family protein [Actinomycetota bacterium]